MYLYVQFGVLCSWSANFLNTMISATYSNRNTMGIHFIDSLLCLLDCVGGQCYLRALE
jgi:hypothetical protein